MESIAPPSTRELRGITLFRDHGDRIIHEGHGRYTVPGCSGGSYTVDLKVFTDEPETCSCPDRAPVCKHIYATAISRSKARAAARKVQRRRQRGRQRQASRLWLRVCDPGDSGGCGVRRPGLLSPLHRHQLVARTYNDGEGTTITGPVGIIEYAQKR